MRRPAPKTTHRHRPNAARDGTSPPPSSQRPQLGIPSAEGGRWLVVRSARGTPSFLGQTGGAKRPKPARSSSPYGGRRDGGLAEKACSIRRGRRVEQASRAGLRRTPRLTPGGATNAGPVRTGRARRGLGVLACGGWSGSLNAAAKPARTRRWPTVGATQSWRRLAGKEAGHAERSAKLRMGNRTLGAQEVLGGLRASFWDKKPRNRRRKDGIPPPPQRGLFHCDSTAPCPPSAQRGASWHAKDRSCGLLVSAVRV